MSGQDNAREAVRAAMDRAVCRLLRSTEREFSWEADDAAGHSLEVDPSPDRGPKVTLPKRPPTIGDT